MIKARRTNTTRDPMPSAKLALRRNDADQINRNRRCEAQVFSDENAEMAQLVHSRRDHVRLTCQSRADIVYKYSQLAGTSQ